MDAQSPSPPSNFFGDRLAELIGKAIKKQMAQSNADHALKPKLAEMVEQQQQTNAQLGHLVTAVTQLKQLQENQQRSIPTPAPSFWKKMGLKLLVDSFDNPAAFIRLYNEAAEKSKQPEFVFSSATIKYLEKLEAEHFEIVYR